MYSPRLVLQNNILKRVSLIHFKSMALFLTFYKIKGYMRYKDHGICISSCVSTCIQAQILHFEVQEWEPRVVSRRMTLYKPHRFTYVHRWCHNLSYSTRECADHSRGCRRDNTAALLQAPENKNIEKAGSSLEKSYRREGPIRRPQLISSIILGINLQTPQEPFIIANTLLFNKRQSPESQTKFLDY